MEADGRGEAPYYTVVGLIGAGKSRLTQRLAAYLGVPAYHEDVENPVLRAFYEEGLTNAAPGTHREPFHLQMNLMLHRLQDLQKVCANGQGGVSDKDPREDLIFAKMLRDCERMSPLMFETVLAWHDFHFRDKRKPDVIVYLRVSPRVALQRIRDRGREMEKGVTLEYLESLHEAYEIWIKEMLKYGFRVVQLDWSEYAKDMSAVVRFVKDTLKAREERLLAEGSEVFKIPKTVAVAAAADDDGLDRFWHVEEEETA